MRKLSKKLIIGIGAAIAALIVVVVLLLSGVFGGGKVGSLSEERYETVGIEFVQMTQVGIHTYDFNITLEEKFEDATDVKLYMSKNDTFDEQKSDALNYTKLEDGTYQIDALDYESGDYFIYVLTGDKTGTFPITVPKMSPKTWMNGDIVNIEFEVDGSTSWSSFIDPEGKNVYRSANKVFDETAVALEENIDILTSSFADPSATLEEPYYYIVFNGKNGKFRYISAPLFYTATQGAVAVEFYEEEGKPYLDITGTLYAVSADAQRVMQLRVGNFDGDDPTATFMVDNSYEGEDTTAFKFKVPLEQLKASSNNLVIFLTENGTMAEWSINAENLSLESYSLSSGNALYGLTDNVALKITRMIDAYESIRASVGTKNGEAILTVSGTHNYGVGGEDYQLVLTATDGQQYVAENTVNDGKKFYFEFPLDQLYSAGIWYDIQIKCVEEITYYDIATSAADLSQTVQVGEKKFSFQEYGGLLKIQYTVVKDFSGLNAKLTTSGGRAQLSVSGSIADTVASNLTLAIRTGDTVIETANTATTDGKFQATLDLSQMKEKETWYDVLIGYKDDNQYYDMSTSNADMSQTAETSSYVYNFEDWEGQLKIQYKDLPVKLSKQKAEIIEEDGKAYLVVTATAVENAADYKLALRNVDTYVTTVKNNAAGKKVSYKVDLSALPKDGTWYDIIIGHEGFGDSTDVSVEAADMETSVTVGKKIYKFADYEGQLKVYYDKVAEDLKGVTAEIKEQDGKPVLIIKGTMKNASSMYLGIRTGDDIKKVDNKGRNDELAFIFDLSKLTSAGTWYDIIIGNSDFSSYKDVTVASADLSQTVSYKKKQFKFAEWNNQLKIYFESDTASGLAEGQSVESTSAVLVLKNGKPVLRVQGTSKGIDNENLQLGIRTGEDVIVVANNTLTKNRYLFDFDLTKLGKSGTWYDVVIIEKESGSYIDVSVKSVYNMDMNISYGDNVYRFADYEGDLKVYYTNTAEEEAAKAQVANNFSNVKVQVTSVNNKPVMKVTAKIGTLALDDVTINVRTKDTVITVNNASTTAGMFEANVDLTKLDSKGTWYDVYWKVASASMDIDLTSDQADMSSTYKYNGYTYQFKEWNSMLKVEFE